MIQQPTRPQGLPTGIKTELAVSSNDTTYMRKAPQKTPPKI